MSSAVGFQTEYSRLAIDMISAERGRQVVLGLDGSIPHPCEDPTTDWAYRLGVLGEEFGEVCKAVIEEQDDRECLEECIHTAAVAMACAEGLLRKMGFNSEDLVDDSYGPLRNYQKEPSRSKQAIHRSTFEELADSGAFAPYSPSGLEAAAPDQHEAVLQEANQIYQSRKAVRPGVWREEGARGALFNMKICMERVWWRYWNIECKELYALAANKKLDVDDFLDLINYAVFAVILLREADRDGSWVYPE